MDNERFVEIMDFVEWNDRILSKISGIRERTIRRWFAGTNDIPAEVGAWLERVYAELRNPPVAPARPANDDGVR